MEESKDEQKHLEREIEKLRKINDDMKAAMRAKDSARLLTSRGLLASLPGKVALFAFSASLVYHFLNGIRHLFWDAGHGFSIPKAYASGYAVLALSVVITAVLWWCGLGGVA